MSNENEPQPEESEAQLPSSPHVAVVQQEETAVSSEHDVSSSSKFDKQRSAKSSRTTSCKTTKTEHMKLSARNRRAFQREREYCRIQYENQLLEDRVRRIQAVPGEYNPDRSVSLFYYYLLIFKVPYFMLINYRLIHGEARLRSEFI